MGSPEVYPSIKEYENKIICTQQIYTDWANHYLEKARCKKAITDLQADICDGVLLADVVQAVTNEKVEDINTKPRNSAQMVENISACLTFLAGLGVNVEGLCAKDIRDGNLKTILGLFFSLSRYKQQQKTQLQGAPTAAQAHNRNHIQPPNPTSAPTPGGVATKSNLNVANANTEMLSSRLPAAPKSNSRCPTVTHPSGKEASGADNSTSSLSRPTRKQGYGCPDRARGQSAPVSHTQNSNLTGSTLSARSSSREPSLSRSTSPSSSTSGIPVPGSRSVSGPRSQSLGDRHPSRLVSSSSQSLGDRHPTRLVNSTSTSSCTSSTSSNRSASARSSASSLTGPNNKNSMLDKFKFFNSKEKADKSKTGAVKGASKGASGSKSRKSADKSNEVKTPAAPESKQPSGTTSRLPQAEAAASAPGSNSPKQAVKGLAKKTVGRTSKKDSLGGASSVAGPPKDDVGPRRPASASAVSTRSTSSGSVASASSSLTSRKSGLSAKRDKLDSAKPDQASPTTARKGSKIASLSAKSSKSSKASAVSAPSTGIPTPSSSGIPKAGSRGTPATKDDCANSKSRTSLSASRDPSKCSLNSLTGAQVNKTAPSTCGRSSSCQTQPLQKTSNLVAQTSMAAQGAARTDAKHNMAAQGAARTDAKHNMSKSVKVNNTNLSQGPLSPRDKIPSLPQDRNANMKAGVSMGTKVTTSSKFGSPRGLPQPCVSVSLPHASVSHGVAPSNLPLQTEAPPTSSAVTPATAKPKKVDSDTQTHVSTLHAANHSHTPTANPPQSHSSPATSSSRIQTSTKSHHSRSDHAGAQSNNEVLIEQQGDGNASRSNSTSNSNNSASSTDSVIFRPSSCDELQSGTESDSNVSRSPKCKSSPRLDVHNPKLSPKVLNTPRDPDEIHATPKKPATDHISALRQSKLANAAAKGGRKMETTFDTEVRTEEKEVLEAGSSRETTIGEETEAYDVEMVKPMQPIMRSTPYSYLRTLTTSSSLMKPSLHVPHLSGSGRIGVSRPLIDPSKLYTNSMKRGASNGTSVIDADYGSDVEGFDISAGYMSDGDILRTNHVDDVNSGYMSEGGASLYAKRMQQRFREGMMAVKECMQKSSGLEDDDSFDDSSSISSGDISDTINEISTDENLTGSSLGSDRTNPYGSLKRAPASHEANNLTTRSLPSRTSNLLHPSKPSNPILGRNLNVGGRDSVDGAGGINWKKYTISDDMSHGQGSSSSAGGKERNDMKAVNYQGGMAGSGFIKKKSNASQLPDLRSRLGRSPGTAIAFEDPNLKEGCSQPSYIPASGGKHKKDSETNTDHSVLMIRQCRQGGSRPSPGGSPAAFGLRRPLSGASSASTCSSKSSSSKGLVNSKMAESEAIRGERLSNYKGSGITRNNLTKTASGTQTAVYGKDYGTDMGPESYNAGTLERKNKSNLVSSKTQTTLSVTATSQNGPEYSCGTPGRKKGLFGSRSSLNKTSPQDPQQVGTIISNPHATFTKGEVTRQSGRSSGSDSPYSSSYLPADYSPQRPLSGMSSPTYGGGSGWMKPNSLIANGMRCALSETESMESLSSASSSIQAQIQQAKALSLASRSILQRDNQNASGLHRSDSFKSTQSEKIFPSSSQANDLPRTNSFGQLSPMGGAPSSPTPSQSSQSSSSRYAYPLSTLTPSSSMGVTVGRSATTTSPYSTLILPLAKMSGSREDDLHGSSLSLVSNSSSIYSRPEEKHSQEIIKLRRELESAHDKVSTLTTQLSTNAHVVSAFEQSLSNMTQRLQHLTCTAEQKDSELNELRATIEALKQQSGLHLNQDICFNPRANRRQSGSSNTSTLSRDAGELPPITRQLSQESMTSLNSMSSACSAASQQSAATDTDSAKKKKKKNWLRSSFSKAFSRKKNKHGSMSDVEPDTASLRSDISIPNSPLLHMPLHPLTAPSSPLKASHSSGALSDTPSQDEAVLDLQQQLHEKDMKLTDIRLEALSSAHQLEQLRETMTRMRNEMHSLKTDNHRLQKLICSKGLNGAGNSASTDSLEKRLSLGDPSSLDLMLSDNQERDGRKITISVSLSPTSDVSKFNETKPSEVLIGAISVSGKIKWDVLDSSVKRCFKEYVLRIDTVTNMGLNCDSVYCYHIGEQITRLKDSKLPELLPCGYLVGDNTNITITLKGTQQNSVDLLAFESLMPKSIVQRYVSLLLEHRRIILCGPSGTGKTYLAQKLAEYLVLKSGKDLIAGSIATFNVDHKSSKELRQYLSNIADQCESTTSGELPNVIILDNLHHIGSLGEVFNGFLSVKYQRCPYIIGTMNQATCSTTNLQLHHNFRWVLCANHMEPVKGFLCRYLRRKLVEEEVKSNTRNNDLNRIVDWVPKVWQHLNKFLETHSSSDVTIGPRLFLSCPMEVTGAQVWFTDLWNYSLVPYMLEAVREGIQTYGRRAAWEDPADWIIEAYPWTNPGEPDWPSLLRMRPEDVGYDTQGAATGGLKTSQAPQSDAESDPLLNMLMRLQEAASYSSPQSNDSDSTSLDSHSSGVQDVASTSGTESTL